MRNKKRGAGDRGEEKIRRAKQAARKERREEQAKPKRPTVEAWEREHSRSEIGMGSEPAVMGPSSSWARIEDQSRPPERAWQGLSKTVFSERT